MTNIIRFPFSVLFTAVLAAFSPISSSAEEVQATVGFPPLVDFVRFDKEPVFCGEPVPLQEHEISERLEKEVLLILWNRPQIILWLKRAGRYFPTIEKILAESGVPEDLKFVAVVESALRPGAVSSKAATGFWQFRENTGLKYGLRIDEAVDERREIRSSTKAAVRYMKYLREMFGSWTLAVAAYNMGEQGLRSEIVMQGSHNFYRLDLPEETQRFIFKIVAAKEILSEPEKHGFHLQPEDFYTPFPAEMIWADIKSTIPVRLIAEAAGTYFKKFKDLNPQLKGYYLPEGKYELFIPKGASGGFAERLEGLREKWELQTRQSYYIVQKGDSLSSIAQRFDVPVLALLLWNGFSYGKVIHPGDRIIVYSSSVKLDGGD